MPWGNGEPWSNGQNWELTAPNVQLAEAAYFDSTIILLQDDAWGHRLGMGDYLGFFPLHFGLYTITEEFGDGEYRIWPPLRKALTSDDFATLYPFWRCCWKARMGPAPRVASDMRRKPR